MCHDSASSSSRQPEAGGQSAHPTQPGSLSQCGLWPGTQKSCWPHEPGWRLWRPWHQRPPWAVLPMTPSSPFGFCKPLRKGRAVRFCWCATNPCLSPGWSMCPPGTHISLTLVTEIKQRNAAYNLQGMGGGVSVPLSKCHRRSQPTSRNFPVFLVSHREDVLCGNCSKAVLLLPSATSE